MDRKIKSVLTSCCMSDFWLRTEYKAFCAAGYFITSKWICIGFAFYFVRERRRFVIKRCVAESARSPDFFFCAERTRSAEYICGIRKWCKQWLAFGTPACLYVPGRLVRFVVKHVEFNSVQCGAVCVICTDCFKSCIFIICYVLIDCKSRRKSIPFSVQLRFFWTDRQFR